MSRPMKEAIVDLVQQKLEGQDSAILVNSSRLTVAQNEILRTTLRSEGVRLLHLRNRVAGLALGKIGFEGLGTILKGPVAMAFGGEGALAISKIVVEQARKLKTLEIVGGYIDGAVIDKDGVELLSKMPGKKELLAMVLQGFFGPVSEFCGSMNNLFTEMHGLIEALQTERGGEG